MSTISSCNDYWCWIYDYLSWSGWTAYPLKEYIFIRTYISGSGTECLIPSKTYFSITLLSIKYMKKITTIFFLSLISFSSSFAAGPDIKCGWLPWCEDSWHEEWAINAIIHLIGEFIQYVAVFAVIVLMISGIMYLVSGWEEEKVKKAKTWIMWSLIGVVLSISAWTIINIINNITIRL